MKTTTNAMMKLNYDNNNCMLSTIYAMGDARTILIYNFCEKTFIVILFKINRNLKIKINHVDINYLI